jgi:predicted rRNA methylase YqxC with S4 and FtsJ domains
MDIGASPGGWTQCLLEMGAGHVVSIDPGDVKVEPASLMSCVEHIRAKVQDCIGELEGRGEQLDMAVCDMNCSPQEAANVLLSARQILKAGALVVITFKKFSQTGKCTGESYRAALDLLRPYCSRMQVEHLFANTLEERSVIFTFTE